MNRSTIVACGCGTVSYWTVQTLLRSGSIEGLTRLVLCDRARIREHNSITCPAYTQVGRPKSDRLAELSCQWSTNQNVEIRAIHGYVEQIQWDDIVPAPENSRGSKLVVLVALDNWESRLTVAEDLRHYSASTSTEVIMIQVGLDRGQASIAVLGCRFSDPCPACGLLSLPAPEPCVLLNVENELLRGDLHLESKAAAGLVEQIIIDSLGSSKLRSLINTKTNLTKISSGDYERFTRSCQMVRDCLGPHTPATPIRWDKVMAPIGAEGDEHDLS